MGSELRKGVGCGTKTRRHERGAQACGVPHSNGGLRSVRGRRYCTDAVGVRVEQFEGIGKDTHSGLVAFVFVGIHFSRGFEECRFIFACDGCHGARQKNAVEAAVRCSWSEDSWGAEKTWCHWCEAVREDCSAGQALKAFA